MPTFTRAPFLCRLEGVVEVIPNHVYFDVIFAVIHTDFQRGFIRAEVFSVDDLVELTSEKAIRDKGRLRVEGKEYTMRDGDVVHFLFNV